LVGFVTHSNKLSPRSSLYRSYIVPYPLLHPLPSSHTSTVLRILVFPLPPLITGCLFPPSPLFQFGRIFRAPLFPVFYTACKVFPRGFYVVRRDCFLLVRCEWTRRSPRCRCDGPPPNLSASSVLFINGVKKAPITPRSAAETSETLCPLIFSPLSLVHPLESSVMQVGACLRPSPYYPPFVRSPGVLTPPPPPLFRS